MLIFKNQQKNKKEKNIFSKINKSTFCISWKVDFYFTLGHGKFKRKSMPLCIEQNFRL